MHSPARLTLERQILPYFASLGSVRRVLFVGCAWYTWRYSFWFSSRGREYWTMELVADRARKYGGPNAIADSFSHLDRHFPGDHFDLIVCNGVIGWGLDDPAEVERTFEQCRLALTPGGVFVLGWNDVEGHRPVDVASSPALGRLRPFTLPTLSAARYDTVGKDGRAFVFNFYERPRP